MGVLSAVVFSGAGCSSPPVEEPQPSAAQQEGLTTTSAFGDALPGLTADELAAFQNGKAHFSEAEDVSEGLGPVFNDSSCVACHVGPSGAVGGSNGRVETRFGFVDASGHFDPLANLGGSLLQDHGIGAVPGFTFVAERVPASANVVAGRRTTPLFGLGLVDATPGSTFEAIAALQQALTPDMAGTVAYLTDLSTGKQAVGKFGWKNGNPTLFQFSGDAYLNEMGITSPLFPHENCPQGDCSLLAYNPRPDLNDADGADVLAFTQFMTFLAPPPRASTNSFTKYGEFLFTGIGCAVCHQPTLSTGSNASAALNNVTYHPYSDFLLHDMGSLGDGIEQGAAGARQMRTAPLWGLRGSPSYLHDGRTTSLSQAILAHDGQGRSARDQFSSLDPISQSAIIAFLKTL